jgi:hypothetical protein
MDTPQTSKAEFLTSLERLAAEPLPHHKMVDALQAVTEEDFTVAELKSVAEVAVVQLSLWRARWLFSSAHAPDTVAEVEDAAWHQVWDVLSSELAQKAPDIAQPMRRMKDLSVARALIQRKLEHDGTSTLRKLWASGAGSFAITLNRLGFRRIAEELYKRALYPRGSVGRNL